MNLGVYYIASFLTIVALSFPVAFAMASLLRFRGCSWGTVTYAALPVWLVVGFLALDAGHARLFSEWHRLQNTALPQHGCLRYEPDIYRLYATYEMSREQFDVWVQDHPWQLGVSNIASISHDGPRLGLIDPEACYATEMAANGKQLRVYYKSDRMYAAYSSN